jgi:uncharacterized protein YgiM (DUF1202 family)
MNIKTIAFATTLSICTFAITASFTSKAFAGDNVSQQICKVTDPTDTPLNVRNRPNGKVINKLKNGKQVDIIAQDADNQGRTWVKIAGFHNGVYREWGWVIREFISCYQA